MSEWIEWKGGECPVSDGVLVEIRYRDGEIDAPWLGQYYRWTHGGGAGDIISYRIIKEKEE